MAHRDDSVEIARYRFRHEAEMAAGRLVDAGIPVVVAGDDIGGMYPGVMSIGVRVARENEERARELLSDAGFLHEVVPPTWSARPAGSSGPSRTRDLSAMALLFGGVALLALDLVFRITGESFGGVLAGAAMAAVGLFLTFRSIAESRESSRRTD